MNDPVYCWICEEAGKLNEMRIVENSGEEDVYYCDSCGELHTGRISTYMQEIYQEAEDMNIPEKFIKKHGILKAVELWNKKI